MQVTLKDIIKAARDINASDIHLAYGLAPNVRVDGALSQMEGMPILDDDALDTYAREIAGKQFDDIATCGELDLAFTMGKQRIRANIYKTQGHTSIALRLLSNTIPPLETLGLPRATLDFPNLRRGIILVTGETGSGKSTTMAALIDKINASRPAHIITLEDPIEYVHTSNKSLVSQREIGTDSNSYADALKAILREDPDVVLIGEMRDYETIQIALTAAETGHLVLTTLHTNSAADSIDRMIDVFPSGLQKQARMQVSTTLAAVLSQQLIPRQDKGRALAAELMVVTPAIRNLIREGKTPQIVNALATSAQVGSVTMDNSLIDLVRTGAISPQNAVSYAHDQDYVARSLGVRV